MGRQTRPLQIYYPSTDDQWSPLHIPVNKSFLYGRVQSPAPTMSWKNKYIWYEKNIIIYGKNDTMSFLGISEPWMANIFRP